MSARMSSTSQSIADRSPRTRSAFAAPSGFVAAVTRPKTSEKSGPTCRGITPETVREAA